MIVVDTNVWSELTKDRGDARILEWLVARHQQLWLSVIVVAEIRMGLELPKAAARRDTLIRWLNGLEDTYAKRILTFDAAAAHVFGALLARRRGEATMLDLQIAAQALVRDIPVATRNIRDMSWTGVKLINPWTA